MTSQGLIFALAGLSLFAEGARISVRSQVYSSSGSVTQIGPEGETWEKGTKYVCMQKWQNPGWGSSEGKFVDKYCLAKYEEAKSTTNFQTAEDMSSCDSWYAGKMRVCPLKGEAPERRLSYSWKANVPKACFRVSDVSEVYSVIEVALDEEACEEAKKLPAEQQIFLPKLTTTTTTTVTTTTTTTTEEEQVEITEDQSAELDADVEIECKALFTDEVEGFTWNYGEAAFKCCTSTKGEGTKLQDMNAEELPSARTFGVPSGCGRMFGDGYHNGLRGYKGAEPSCLVPTSVLKKITGDEFEALKAKLQGSA